MGYVSKGKGRNEGTDEMEREDFFAGKNDLFSEKKDFMIFPMVFFQQ